MTTLHESVTTAYLQGDELVLEDFHERDPDVVALVRESDDKEAAVHRCLGMGARVLRLAGATLDTQLVEHRFGEMAGSLDRSIDSFVERVDESAARLLDEESGELARALGKWLEEVSSTLEETFDENDKRSAIAKLETVLEKARTEQVSAVRRLLDPENDESPLAGWRREIVKTVERKGEALEKAIRDLREQLEIGEALAGERERGTQKGRTFEQVVVEQVTEIVRHFEDTVEHCGDTAGTAGGKVGDVVVTVDAGQTPGYTARYVLEVKDRQLPLKSALAELDQAMANRDAAAGIMVFARDAQCPVKTPFQWYDSKAVVVLDKETLDPLALRLACLWARWVVCREEAGAREALDPAHVRALIENARLALGTSTRIKGGHTRATRAIEDAGRQLCTLVDEVRAVLDELEQALVSA